MKTTNPKVDLAIRPLIRAMNSNAFHSGKWARITGVAVHTPRTLYVDRGEPRNRVEATGSPRVCFEVEFINGSTDLWPVEDAAAEYEFSPSIRDPRPEGGAR